METFSSSDTFLTTRSLIPEGGNLNKPILEQNLNGRCEKILYLLGRLYRTGCDLGSFVFFVTNVIHFSGSVKALTSFNTSKLQYL